MTPKEIAANCPEGYKVYRGETIDMLGKTEAWMVHENRAEPDMMRIPQDFFDTEGGVTAKRVPAAWGKLLYYKVI